MKRVWILVLAGALLAACGPNSAQKSAEIPAAPAAPTIDPVVEALVRAALPDLEITGGTLDESDGEYEIAGLTPDGASVEIDLTRVNNVWTIAEIQRDIEWANVPEPVRAAASAAPNAFEPARVIESQQPSDGSIVYELFKPGTPPGHSDLEVRWLNNEARVLPAT